MIFQEKIHPCESRIKDYNQNDFKPDQGFPGFEFMRQSEENWLNVITLWIVFGTCLEQRHSAVIRPSLCIGRADLGPGLVTLVPDEDPGNLGSYPVVLQLYQPVLEAG